MGSISPMAQWEDGIRPGRGGPKTVKTQITLLPEQHEALVKAAEDQGISVSGLIRRLINDVLMED